MQIFCLKRGKGVCTLILEKHVWECLHISICRNVDKFMVKRSEINLITFSKYMIDMSKMGVLGNLAFSLLFYG